MEVWIHCRGFHENLRYLIDYQEELLVDYANKKSMKVLGVSKLNKSIDYEDNQIKEMINYITNKKVQAILVYDKTCITSKQEEIIEFEMLCRKNDVKIINAIIDMYQ